MGWSDLFAVAQRAKAEAIPIMNEPIGFAKGSILATTLDCPTTGKSVNPVQPHLQKYSTSRLPQISNISLTVPSHRGALRNVINAGRDAVDADGAQDEGANSRTAKSCGPDAPTLESSWRSYLRRRRWQKSPVTGESTK